MGTMLRGIAINDLIGVVQASNPALLTELKVAAPAIADALEPQAVRVEGPLPTAPSTSSLPTEDAATHDAAVFTLSALQETSNLCNKGIAVGNRRVVEANRIRLFAQCIAVLTSSGVLASFAVGSHTAEITSAILATLASLATVFSNYFNNIPTGGMNADRLVLELTKLVFDVELCKSNISTFLKYPGSSSIEGYINTGNTLAKRVKELVIPLLGIAEPATPAA